MKIIKIYLVIVTVLLVVGLGFGVYVWFTIQKLSVQTGSIPTQTKTESSQEIVPVIDSTSTNTPATKPVTIKKVDLPQSQQDALKAFGIKGDTFVITPQMISCAENALGKLRLDEILKGASPTPLESMKLLPCFKV